MPEFSVRCNRCSALLDADFSSSSSRREIQLDVDPCEKCLAEAENRGENTGYDRGFAEGESEA